MNRYRALAPAARVLFSQALVPSAHLPVAAQHTQRQLFSASAVCSTADHARVSEKVFHAWR